MQEVVLLHFTGDDRPGLTASLTAVLAQHGIEVLDLNQTVIHRSLLMGMLNNGLILMGLAVSEQMIVRGLIILAAVALTLREPQR